MRTFCFAKRRMTLSFDEIAALYCETQEQTPSGLRTMLRDMVKRFEPDGFLLAECAMLDSSRVGERVIIPYGPRNTLKTPPEQPFSPRGLASDTSVVVGVMPVASLDSASRSEELGG